MHSRESLQRGGALLLCVALLFGCGDESAEGPASGTATIGPAGGVLSSTDGKVELTFPEGAVAGDVTVIITLEEQDVSGVNPITPVYRFEPAGTTFAVPVKVRFRYEEDARGAAAGCVLDRSRRLFRAAGLWRGRGGPARLGRGLPLLLRLRGHAGRALL